MDLLFCFADAVVYLTLVKTEEVIQSINSAYPGPQLDIGLN